MDIVDLKQRLQERIEDVITYLLPNGKKQKSRWITGNTEGDQGQSLQVELSGPKAGLWIDYATGEGGDVIDLWMASRSCGIRDAISQIKAYLGVDDQPTFSGYHKPKYKRPVPPQHIAVSPHWKAVHSYLSGRGLTDSTIQAFSITSGPSEKIGPIIVFPYLAGKQVYFIKYLAVARMNGKKVMWSSGKETEAILFGWQTIPDKAREVTIVEGEINAMSLYQMGIPALAVPYGAGKDGKQEWVENEYSQLERFERINLMFDDDGPGREAIRDLCSRLGHYRCHVVRPIEGGKDANDCLRSDVQGSVLLSAISDATTIDPEELRNAAEFVEDTIEQFYPSSDIRRGFAMPFDQARDIVRFKPGEYSLWYGHSGHAKSTTLAQILTDSAREGHRVCIASFELTAGALLSIFCRQLTGSTLIGHTEEEKSRYMKMIRDCHIWMSDKLWIFNLYGSGKADRMFEVFEYARKRYGITQFLIDSMFKCVREGDNDGQQKFIEQITDLSAKHNVHTHLIAHVRKEGTDENAPPKKEAVRGSYTVTDAAANVISVWRNKDKEQRIRKRREYAQRTGTIPNFDDFRREEDARLTVLKSRWAEDEPSVLLWYDRPSKQFLESPLDYPRITVSA